MTYKASIVAQGIAIGKVQTFVSNGHHIEPAYCQNPHQAIDEFHHALDQAVLALETLKNKTKENDDYTSVLTAQIFMVKDKTVLESVERLIHEKGYTAAYSYQLVIDKFINTFDALPDGLFKERAQDIRDVKQRVLNHLVGQSFSFHKLNEVSTIIFTEDLVPSDLASFDRQRLAGIVLEKGGLTSHTAILAKSLGIPVLMHAKTILAHVRDGQTVIVNAFDGEIHVNPTRDQLTKAKESIKALDQQFSEYKPYVTLPTKTKNNVQIQLAANLLGTEMLEQYNDSGAEGVGLLRTEFMFINEEASMEKQIEDYQRICERIEDVTFRTFDIGADKPFLSSGYQEANPQLGLRGIRLALKETDMFKRQLRALLIASKNSKQLKVMIPMVTTVDEIKSAKAVLNHVIEDLDKANVPYQRNILFGMMVETPAAALNIKAFSPYVDFFSVGTNDLMQYLFATDRDNTAVNDRVESFEPFFIRLLHSMIKDAKSTMRPISICGEIASQPAWALLFIGMGVDTLSVSLKDVLPLRKLIASFNYEDLVTLSEQASKEIDASKVRALINALLRQHI